MMVFLNF